MEQKLDSHVFIGMQQDLATSLHDPKYLREAWNIRITPREGHTGQSITNEQGTVRLNIDYEGNYIGHCVLNQYLVLFTTDGDFDYIYRINMYFPEDEDIVVPLYKGHLNFSLSHPLETLASYENEKVQKVYWTDSVNQPRMINILSDKVYKNESTGEWLNNYDDYSFDFVQPLALNEVINVERMVGATGAFPSGVLQYAFTYYNQYGQETNIAYITTLQYVSFNDRGASPEENVALAFRINVENVDLRFDYMRIYRIHRSSLNGTPAVQRIQDIDLRELQSREHQYRYLTPVQLSDSLSYYTENKYPSQQEGVSWNPGICALYNTIGTALASVQYKDYSQENPVWTSLTSQSFQSFAYGQVQGVLPQYFPDAVSSDPFLVTDTFPDNGQVNAIIINHDDFPELVFRVNQDRNYYYIMPKQGKQLVIANIPNPWSPNYYQIGHEVLITQGNVTYKIYSLEGEESRFENVPVIEYSDRDTPMVLDQEPELIKVTSFSYIDTGLTGENVDPAKMLYLGGEDITVGTMCEKDNTLFLGDITINRASVPQEVKDLIKGSQINSGTRSVQLYSSDADNKYDSKKYNYVNTLSSNTSGFKMGEWYRLGVQFQHKTGKWSEPVWVEDGNELQNPYLNVNNVLAVPTFNVTLNGNSIFRTLYEKGYIKARPVIVFPSVEDRAVVTQGVVNPTMYTVTQRNIDKGLYSQSSWFFRFLNMNDSNTEADTSTVTVKGNGVPGENANYIQYMDIYKNPIEDVNENTDPRSSARAVEIEGHYLKKGTGEYQNVYIDKFQTDWDFVTYHTPDVEFDDSLQILQWEDVDARIVGEADGGCCISNIYMETATPPINSESSGFDHKSFISQLPKQMCSGLFYEDYMVEDSKEGDTVNAFDVPIKEYSPVRWLIYPWQGTGSLNNDIVRPAGKGTRTSELSVKIISNLKQLRSFLLNPDPNVYEELTLNGNPVIFSGQELTLIKVNGDPYSGNIDTMLIPSDMQAKICAFNAPYLFGKSTDSVVTPFEENVNWYLVSLYEASEAAGEKTDSDGSHTGKWGQYGDKWKWGAQAINYQDIVPSDKYDLGPTFGNWYPSLARKKVQVRMKYRSTTHLTFRVNKDEIRNWAFPQEGRSNNNWWIKLIQTYQNHGSDESPINSCLPIVELYRYKENDDLRQNTMFGGRSTDALMQNFWLPADEAVREYKFDAATTQLTLHYNYGDTWYQRYDCMKTYPMANTDPNQIVEIGSFLLETRVNIDGRYDRNRGQVDNTIMNPTNFNKLNRVYSQLDNFFSYKIMDDDFYYLDEFHNQVTWTLEKQAGAQVDPWTQITLTATKDLQGDRGHVASLNTWQDRIFCFQPRAINEIIFNPRVQIPTTDGTPIEITNGMKLERIVQIADGQGCDNKWAIKSSANGLYFIEEITKNLQVISSKGFEQISEAKNMSRYFESLKNWTWNPLFYSTKLEYDSHNSDLYVTSTDRALSFSEKMGEFISYYNYPQMMAMFTIGNDTYSIYEGIRNSWIDESGVIHTEFTPSEERGIHRMFCGKYNYLYDNTYPYSISFISNAEPALDKIFTNLEMRADLHNSNDEVNSMITNLPYEEEYSVAHHTVPFNRIRVFNEYQDTGEKVLSFNIGSVTNNFQKKFRIWRADIPRDQVKRLDRIRNTWTCITLKMTEPLLKFNKVQLNDVMVKYFI